MLESDALKCIALACMKHANDASIHLKELEGGEKEKIMTLK